MKKNTFTKTSYQAVLNDCEVKITFVFGICVIRWIVNPVAKHNCLHDDGVQTPMCLKGPRWDMSSLHWRHNGRDSVSSHQPHDCLLNRLFRRRLKKTSKLRVTGFCVGNSPGTGEFPAQMASNAENVSTWWRHHVMEYMSNYVDIYLWYVTSHPCP